MKLALFQPDIPQNAASAIRLCACLGVELHVIEPCGFAWDLRKLKSVALDYLELAAIARHSSFSAFERWRGAQNPKPRLVLLTTKAAQSHLEFSFRPDDIILLGRESGGVTPEVIEAAEARLRIPLNPAARSLNVVIAGAIALGEGLRQTAQYPKNPA